MNKNVAIILSIAAILITVTCVGATVINSDENMKQDTFDGIKMNVPHDADFIQITDGFKENTYGITVHTFKDNQSMVNFLNSLQGAKIVSLNDQPPQSVAFTQDGATNILVTNGKEGICVGAVDQDLVLKMANSVIFSNGHPSERSHGFVGVGQKHLDKDKDFDLMVGLMVLVNNAEININSYNAAIVTTVSQTNQMIDSDVNFIENNQSSEYGSLDNNSINSDSSNTDNVNTDNSGSSDTGSSDSGSIDTGSSDSGSTEESSYSESECKQMVNEYLQGSDCSISSVDDNNGVYTFHIEDSHGTSAGVITVDSKTGEMNTNGFEIPEEPEEDSSDLEEMDMV